MYPIGKYLVLATMEGKMNAIKRIYAPTHSADIYIAGNVTVADEICRQFCYVHGFCVTLEPIQFIYKGGDETGIRVGVKNYPRFPRTENELLVEAERLARKLMDGLFQKSCMVCGTPETIWLTRRDEDQ